MTNKLEHVTSANMPTKYGKFLIHGFKNVENGEEHIALVKGEINPEEAILTRIHSECLTGDALGSARCDCGDQYDAAMKMIASEGKGILVYLRQEGRGIGLINKLKAYELQDRGLDTVEANIELGFAPDLRDYSIGVEILKFLKTKKLRLMTNNPDKINGLEKYGIEIVERVAIETAYKADCKDYMRTKKDKMGHILKN